MERLRAAVCEDDRGERERLVQMVSESAPDVTVEAFGSAEELLDAYYPGKFDVILLDIYMEGMTGIRALEKIRRIDTDVVAAIATTSQDFALESYRLRAARYLEKPVSGEEIADLLRYVIRKKEAPVSRQIFFPLPQELSGQRFQNPRNQPGTDDFCDGRRGKCSYPPAGFLCRQARL